MKVGEMLKRCSVRLTPTREAVLKVLVREKRPMSYKEVIGGLKSQYDRVTVYRTLLLLLDKKMVHRVMDMKGAWRFCAHDPGKHGCPGDHPHFECRICGRMKCLEWDSLPHIEVEPGTIVEGKNMVVYGVCAQCANRFAKEGGRKR